MRCEPTLYSNGIELRRWGVVQTADQSTGHANLLKIYKIHFVFLRELLATGLNVEESVRWWIGEMEYKEIHLITQLFACYGIIILCITKIMPIVDQGSLATWTYFVSSQCSPRDYFDFSRTIKARLYSARCAVLITGHL